jgi:hypothetical protein
MPKFKYETLKKRYNKNNYDHKANINKNYIRYNLLKSKYIQIQR